MKPSKSSTPPSPTVEKPSADTTGAAGVGKKDEVKSAAAHAEAAPAAATDGAEQQAVDAMLPPTAAGPAPEKAGSADAAKVDSLLPPGVASQPVPANRPLPVTTQQIEQDKAGPSVPTRSRETIGVPTEDGGFVKLHEPVKKVEFAGEEIELHRLTPEERARKRLFKNIIMLVVGVIALVGTAAILMLAFNR